MVEKKWLDPGRAGPAGVPGRLAEGRRRKLGGVPDDDRYHIYDRARAELEAQGITQDQINTEGLTVTTTVDAAEQTQRRRGDQGDAKGQPDNLRYALVSVDPKTGAILAYYGGSNGLGTDYAQALRQPGLVVQAVRAGRRAAGRHGPERHAVGLGTIYDGESGQSFAGVTVEQLRGLRLRASATSRRP